MYIHAQAWIHRTFSVFYSTSLPPFVLNSTNTWRTCAKFPFWVFAISPQTPSKSLKRAGCWLQRYSSHNPSITSFDSFEGKGFSHETSLDVCYHEKSSSFSCITVFRRLFLAFLSSIMLFPSSTAKLLVLWLKKLSYLCNANGTGVLHAVMYCLPPTDTAPSNQIGSNHCVESSLHPSLHM